MEPPDDLFYSLDMLAEVASRTVPSDVTSTPNMPLQPPRGSDQSLVTPVPYQRSKISSTITRRSPSSSEKLTLEQIKGLSEKNLIEWFSEHVCDEMKKNYSFQCYLIPEECTMVYHSFGSETKARLQIKAHLQNHIKDLSAAAEDTSKTSEIFMAEPLHIRKKRLKETPRKFTRKKKQVKAISGKQRKDSATYDYFEDETVDTKYFESDDQADTKSGKHTALHSDTKVDSWKSVYKTCANENVHNYFKESDEYKYIPYSSEHSEFAYDDQLVLTGRSYKRPKSKVDPDSRKKTCISQDFSSDYTQYKPPSFCDVDSEIYLDVIHDHSYATVSKNYRASSSGEITKFSYKIYKDFEKKKFHQCLPNEHSLIIPTPPFPYVYMPVLPHIAHVQEIGINFKTSEKWKAHDFSDGLCYQCYIKPSPVKSLPKNECLIVTSAVDPVIDKVHPSNTKTMEACHDNASNTTSDIKLPGPSFCIDLFKPE